MRELKPIADVREPGTIILVAADAGEGGGERFALPVTDELRELVAAVPVPDGDPLDDDAAAPVRSATAQGVAEQGATAQGVAAQGTEKEGAPAGEDADGEKGTGADAADGSPDRPAPLESVPDEPRMVLRPREIQDRVRAGASVAELIELTGMPARRIEPFAHPVLAERARIAELGKQSRPRRADGPAQLTLWEILATAFAARGLDLATSEWDAWRDPAGQWIIGVTWSAGHSTTTAEWAFHAEGATSSTVARNTIAAELVDPDFARPRRNLASVEGEAPGLRPAPPVEEAPGPVDHGAPEGLGDGDDDDDFLRHPDEDAAPRRRRKTVMPSWEDVLLGVRPTDRK
ncbi:septation protein SepH [Corynebacterium hansenii]|uniref:Septation protein SepH n=1 Tax=Corynebacterium hansenii TaxID=394964 RepID=A0ABV7ZP07_9CORY|nr:septation protein SepH [Corynebacterium hansenii]WJZ00878.1 hypothetical protein CHAN_11405 [Corynebacterium hansenii]